MNNRSRLGEEKPLPMADPLSLVPEVRQVLPTAVTLQAELVSM